MMQIWMLPDIKSKMSGTFPRSRKERRYVTLQDGRNIAGHSFVLLVLCYQKEELHKESMLHTFGRVLASSRIQDLLEPFEVEEIDTAASAILQRD